MGRGLRWWVVAVVVAAVAGLVVYGLATRPGRSRGAILSSRTVVPLREVSAADWPRTLGPAGTFTGDGGTPLVDSFPESGPKVVWHAQTSPSLAGVTVACDRVYTVGITRGGTLHTADDGIHPHMARRGQATVEVTVYCLDAATGKQVWRLPVTVPGSFPVFNVHAKDAEAAENGVLMSSYYGPKSAPTIDAGRAYVFLFDGTLLCLDAASGRKVWSKEVRTLFKTQTGRFGYAGAPLIVDDLVVVPAYAEDFCLAAFHKDTGELAWKGGTMGDPALKQMRCDGYSSPVLAEIEGRRQIVHFTGGGVQAVAADTGELLWNFPLAGGTREIVPSPVIQGNHVFVGSAYCATNLMLRIENGKPTEEWRNRNLINHFSNIVYANGSLFGSDANYHASTFRCMDFATGERKWSAEFRDTPEKGKEQAFVLAADGKLLILTAYGELILAKASTEAFEPLGRVRLAEAGNALKFWPSPALAEGRFYCQNTGGEIWCVDLRK